MVDRSKEMKRSLKVKSITDKLHTSGVSLDKILDSLKRGNLSKRAAGLKGGGIAQRGLGRAFNKGGKA